MPHGPPFCIGKPGMTPRRLGHPGRMLRRSPVTSSALLKTYYADNLFYQFFMETGEFIFSTREMLEEEALYKARAEVKKAS
jgi:hypothetical protein